MGLKNPELCFILLLLWESLPVHSAYMVGIDIGRLGVSSYWALYENDSSTNGNVSTRVV